MQRGLGRGLEALLPKYKTKPNDATAEVPVEKIHPNPHQPRKKFDEAKLKELAASIKTHGLAQPIVVTSKATPGEYEIIAGERRLRAAKLAGLKEVPVVVRHADDKTKFHLSLVENIQREDLNPVEEAAAYKNLMTAFGHTQEEIAKALGKDRSVIANAVRLLSLPGEIRELLEDGSITAGHGRAIAAVADAEKQMEIIKKILDRGLTVREVETIVTEIKKSGGRPMLRKTKRPTEIIHLETSLEHALGAKVRVTGGVKRGKISIHYYSLEDLERLSRLLKKASGK